MPLNITNVKKREKDIIKTTRGKTNKVRKTSLKISNLVLRGDLLNKGWNQRQITQLKRYLILKSEYGTLSREYIKTLENLEKNNFANVIAKVKTLSGNSILLKDDLLLNVLEKSRSTPSVDQLASKLKDQFGDFLTKYNINLDTIITELKEEVKTTYQQLDIDRQDYSSYLESVPGSSIVSTLTDLFKSFWNRVKGYLSNLFAYQVKIESCLYQLDDLLSPKLESYKPIYKENYQFDLRSIDNLKKTYIDHDPSQDYKNGVDEIQIVDVKFEDEEYFNLNKSFGGIPRISSKGSFTAFAEDHKDKINRRSVTVNGKTKMIYTPLLEGYKLYWIDGQITCSIAQMDISTKTEYKILVISAKKLKSIQDRDKVRQMKVKDIKKLAKYRYSNGSDK